MKNYKHSFLVVAIVLVFAVFLVPFAVNAESSSSGLFTFISPSGGEKIVAGKTYDIQWKGPIKWIVSPKVIESISDVKLTLSCGDPLLGATNDTVIVKSTDNDGLYRWSVPKKIGLSDYCRIIIQDKKGKYHDVSPVFGIGMTPPLTLNVSCSASPNPANINQAVTFASSISGGTGTYSYSWSSACTSTTANCTNSFPSSGNYSASLAVTSGSQFKSASCSVIVNAPIPVGSLVLSKYAGYPNQTTAVPVTAYKLAHFILTADPAEAINVNTIRADLTNLSAYTNNLYVKFGGNTTAVKATVGATNTWSVNYSLVAGQTIDVIVYGDINSLALGTGQVSLLISGTGANSATSINTNSGSPLAGQNINFVIGSISSAIDGSTPMAQAVSGNQQVTAAKFKFTASNDSYTITEAKITVNNNNGAIINSASIKDGSTVLATVPYDSINNWLYFTGLNVAIPSNTTKALTVNLSLGNPFTDGTTITTGKNVKLSLISFKYLNSQGIQAVDSNTRTANDLYVYKSIPTFTVGSAPIGQGINLSAGATTNLYNFTVSTGVNGDVSLKQLKFNTIISKNSSNGVPALSNFKLFRGSTDVTSLVTIQDNGGNSLEGVTGIGVGNNVIVLTFNTEEVSPAGTTYTYALRAIPSGFAISDSVSTSLLGDISASADSALYYLSATSNTAVQTLYTVANHNGGDTAENIIWSDNSALIHDYSYSASSQDWFNGYLINNLPLDSVGIVAQ